MCVESFAFANAHLSYDLKIKFKFLSYFGMLKNFFNMSNTLKNKFIILNKIEKDGRKK